MPKPSPFPGMDPWLERFWATVHHGYIQFACSQISGQLPDSLFAEVEETVYIIESGGESGVVRRDVAVFEQNQESSDEPGEFGRTGLGGAAIATPIRIELDAEPVPVRHVAIRSVGGGEPLVTAVELISPSNKFESRGRKLYQRKRRSYYEAGVNVVEIDLLRSGRPLIDVPWTKVSRENQTPYRAVVRRAPKPEAGPLGADYYPIPLRDRLPTILVPLNAMNDDATLDLQLPLDESYLRGRYDIRIDYRDVLEPRLPADDAAWAAERIAAGSR